MYYSTMQSFCLCTLVDNLDRGFTNIFFRLGSSEKTYRGQAKYLLMFLFVIVLWDNVENFFSLLSIKGCSSSCAIWRIIPCSGVYEDSGGRMSIF